MVERALNGLGVTDFLRLLPAWRRHKNFSATSSPLNRLILLVGRLGFEPRTR